MTSSTEFVKNLHLKVVSRLDGSWQVATSQLKSFALREGFLAIAAHIDSQVTESTLSYEQSLDSVFKYHADSGKLIKRFISHFESNVLEDFPLVDTSSDRASSETSPAEIQKLSISNVGWEEHEGILRVANPTYEVREFANNVANAWVPWRYFQQVKEAEDRNVKFFLPETISSDYFLFGETGSGKSTDAVRAVMNALKEGKSAKYISCSDITDILENRASLKFEKEYKARVVVDHSRLKHQMASADLLVIDEIVGISRLVVGSLEQIVETRFRSGKPTIYVSNHCFDKATSLNNKTISQVVGRRICSRIKAATAVNYGYKDFRGPVKSDDEKNAEIQLLAENFKMPNLILAHPDVAHFPTFVGRNFIFKAISPQERAALTGKDENGRIIEESRSGTEYATNVWSSGDSLHINGAVCDDGDAKTLIALFQILSVYHASGARGSLLSTNITQICSALGIQPTGPNITAVKRRLRRLASMNIYYDSGKKGVTFNGSFISLVSTDWSKNKDSVVTISFNSGIAALYLANEFTRMTQYDKDATGIAYVMKLFIATHKDQKVSIPNKKLLLLLGKDHLEKDKADKLLENQRRKIKSAKIGISYSSAAQSQTLTLG